MQSNLFGAMSAKPTGCKYLMSDEQFVEPDNQESGNRGSGDRASDRSGGQIEELHPSMRVSLAHKQQLISLSVSLSV